MKQKRLDIYEEEENSRFRSTGSAGREVLTPLQRAIMDGDIDTVAEMLENGEDVNQTVVSSDGYTGTPMMTALALDNSMIRLEMVKLLLNHGASPNAIMCRGRNIALRYVLTHSRTEANLADLIALLVDAGAKPDPDLLDIEVGLCQKVFNHNCIACRNSGNRSVWTGSTCIDRCHAVGNEFTIYIFIVFFPFFAFSINSHI